MPFILGIILVPLTAILGSILGWKLVKGRRLYKFIGLVAGFLALPALCIFLIGRSYPNKAQVESDKFVKGISALHPKLICDDGDPGYGPDNTTPWYTGYYFIDANTNAQKTIEQSANHMGIQLTEDASYIQQLKGQSDTAPFGDEAFNPDSTYLAGKGLKITIARDGSVPTWCQNRWGQKESVKPGEYILYSTLTD